jgi:hypothetical protein
MFTSKCIAAWDPLPCLRRSGGGFREGAIRV